MGDRDRFDRRAGERPLCPFCEEQVGRARFTEGSVTEEFETGSCTYCGALFVCDPTAKKRGAALMELLLRLVGGDLQQSVKLRAEQDYEQETVLDYNPKLHRVIPSGDFKGRRQIFSKSGFGALIFIRRLKNGEPLDDPAEPEGA